LKRILFALQVTVLSSTFWAAQASARPAFDEYAEGLVKQRDYLGLRIFLKSYANYPKKSVQSWRYTRGLVDAVPQAGFDLLYAWKFVAPELGPSTQEINRKWETANRLMLEKKFRESVEILTELTENVKVRMLKLPRTSPVRSSLTVLYPYLLHSLGRALYGSGNYADAKKVYAWIPAGYVFFRQVLFERMWNFYQLGDAAGTLASIASQKSAFYGPYLHPEAYLLQIYIYKRLCRDQELEFALRELRTFKSELDRGSFTLERWARWDTEHYVLFRLINPENLEFTNGIPRATRVAELKGIQQKLQRQYDQQLRTLRAGIDKVLAFSSMAALSNTNDQLNPIEKVKSRAEIIRSGYEVWPFDLGEEWSDEIGTQKFLGSSQCTSR